MHIAFHDEFVKIFVPRSKTVVYRESNFVYASKTRTNYCPVSILDRYIKTVYISPSCSQPILYLDRWLKRSPVTVCGTENFLTPDVEKFSKAR